MIPSGRVENHRFGDTDRCRRERSNGASSIAFRVSEELGTGSYRSGENRRHRVEVSRDELIRDEREPERRRVSAMRTLVKRSRTH